jgi:predicted esterase
MTFLASIVVLTALSGAAQDTQPNGAPLAAQMRATVRRADLARSYLLLERALDAVALPPDDREAVNRAVDAITLLFFSGRTSEAVGRLNETTAKILGLRGAERLSFEALAGQRAVLEPNNLRIGANPVVGLDLEWLVPGIPPPTGTQILVVGPDGETFAQPLGPTVRLHPGEAARAGRYDLFATTEDLERPVPLASAFVTREDPARLRSALSERLERCEREGLGREADRAATRSRLALLDADESRRASLPIDLAALERELMTELDELEAGRSPWIGRTGDAWRTVRASGGGAPIDLPVRVLVPQPREGAERPALVIALHGAGGDEHMFLEAYGNGLLGRLALERAAVVACPSTPAFMATPLLFDALVEEMIACHDIDPQRIHLLGHSMGAGAASALARLRGDRIASMALLAGGGELLPGGPPALIVGAGLDPLIPASRLKSLAERGREAGASVEFRELPREGHLLVVTLALPEALDWVLARRLAQRSPRRERRKGRSAGPKTIAIEIQTSATKRRLAERSVAVTVKASSPRSGPSA